MLYAELDVASRTFVGPECPSLARTSRTSLNSSPNIRQRCWTSSKHTLRNHGSISTCSEISNSRTRSFRIRPAFFPPKSRSKSSPKIGRRQIDDIFAVSIGYRKSLWPLWYLCAVRAKDGQSIRAIARHFNVGIAMIDRIKRTMTLS